MVGWQRGKNIYIGIYLRKIILVKESRLQNIIQTSMFRRKKHKIVYFLWLYTHIHTGQYANFYV